MGIKCLGLRQALSDCSLCRSSHYRNPLVTVAEMQTLEVNMLAEGLRLGDTPKSSWNQRWLWDRPPKTSIMLGGLALCPQRKPAAPREHSA